MFMSCHQLLQPVGKNIQFCQTSSATLIRPDFCNNVGSRYTVVDVLQAIINDESSHTAFHLSSAVAQRNGSLIETSSNPAKLMLMCVVAFGHECNLIYGL